MAVMKHIPIHVAGFVGPGSQPEEADGAALDVLPMPSAMSTYVMPVLPEPEQIRGLNPAKSALQTVLALLDRYLELGAGKTLDVSDLDAANRRLLDQTLGEGEVSVVFAERDLGIQESILAGIWRVQGRDAGGNLVADAIDVGPIPTEVAQRAFAGAAEHIDLDPGALPEGLQNAPSLVAELNEAIARSRCSDRPHVINLSLLPHTPEDLLWLGEVLGKGRVTMLFRGYGNCRIVSTGTREVWWVQYFNSQEMLILNTLEVTSVPLVACAAREDLEDSRERLAEILAVLA